MLLTLEASLQTSVSLPCFLENLYYKDKSTMLDILESAEKKDSIQESLLERRIMARLLSEER